MPFDTQAIVIPAPGQDFQLLDVTLDDPLDDEVVVDMVACGLCHTDLAIQSGAFPSPSPSIPGHEGAGIVHSVGKNIPDLHPGDRVLLSYTSCRNCSACQSKKPGACVDWDEMNFMRKRGGVVGDKPGAALTAESISEEGKTGEGTKVWAAFFGQSSLSKRAVVARASCVKVPEDTDLRLFAPLGCGLQTGAGAVLNNLKPTPDSSIAIYGCGAVGMSAILAAAYLGVKTIIAVDIIPQRLTLAKEFGATHVVSGKSPTCVQDVRDITPFGAGTQYAVEASGNAKVLRVAYDALGSFGHLTSCGTPGPGVPAPMGIHEHVTSGKIYSGTLMGNDDPNNALPRLIAMYHEGKFPIDKMTRFYKLTEFDQAVHAMHTGEVIKPVIVFD